MRQFSYVTWDAYNHVYSLSYKHATVTERGSALRKTDRAFETWFNSWFHDCTWAKEPHGLVVKLRILHMRLLLYRVFLNLLVQKARKREPLSDDLQDLATICIQIAIDLVNLVVKSIHMGVQTSGTLQGAFFHAMAYLWNALVTLLLYASSRSAQKHLSAKSERFVDVVQLIKDAVVVFDRHKDAVAFANTASQKITTLLEKIGRNQDSAARTAAVRGSIPETPLSPGGTGWTPAPELGVGFPDFDDFDDFDTFFDMDLQIPFPHEDAPNTA
jgi:hypothetical protein